MGRNEKKLWLDCKRRFSGKRFFTWGKPSRGAGLLWGVSPHLAPGWITLSPQLPWVAMGALGSALS